MPGIFDMMPDVELLLSLEPEELAGVVLEYLNAFPPTERGQLNTYNFSLPHTVAGYPPARQKDVARALMEAWSWLQREGMIAHDPGQHVTLRLPFERHLEPTRRLLRSRNGREPQIPEFPVRRPCAPCEPR